jgi:hypothetical protein
VRCKILVWIPPSNVAFGTVKQTLKILGCVWLCCHCDETSIPTLGLAPKKLRKPQNVVRFGNVITPAASGLLGSTSRPSLARQHFDDGTS